jgi:hypothetical protein
MALGNSWNRILLISQCCHCTLSTGLALKDMGLRE